MSDNLIELAKDNNYKVDLMKYVPDFIYNCPPTNQIFNTEEYTIGALNYYIQDLIDQCYILTASDHGLTIWEKEYGIITDTSLSLESRRQTLLAKKAGIGVVNVAKIKEIAEAYDCGCEVEGHYEEYYFIITFTDIGIPSNLNAFKDIIEKIKPAHLGVIYKFTYETWQEVLGFSWQTSLDFSWNQVLTEPLHVSNKKLFTLLSDGTYKEINLE